MIITGITLRVSFLAFSIDEVHLNPTQSTIDRLRGFVEVVALLLRVAYFVAVLGSVMITHIIQLIRHHVPLIESSGNSSVALCLLVATGLRLIEH